MLYVNSWERENKRKVFSTQAPRSSSRPSRAKATHEQNVQLQYFQSMKEIKEYLEGDENYKNVPWIIHTTALHDGKTQL